MIVQKFESTRPAGYAANHCDNEHTLKPVIIDLLHKHKSMIEIDLI